MALSLAGRRNGEKGGGFRIHSWFDGSFFDTTVLWSVL